jgi:hypothetical protein
MDAHVQIVGFIPLLFCNLLNFFFTEVALFFQLVASSRNEYLKLKARVENLQRTQR